MSEELRRNVAWVRSVRPVIKPDGIFGREITMNPCAIVENDTIFLFYASYGTDKNSPVYNRRQIHLATAPLDDPDNFTHYGTVVSNDTTPGSFDYAWCVLPHVVKIREGLYYMIYTGNCGQGGALSSFPGLGVAWSPDLYHWTKYEHNPVLSTEGEPFVPIIGIAGGGLYKEDTEDGFLLHLFYTACPTDGRNVFTNQQKTCNCATSTDGIHWERHGTIHARSTWRDYEDIASTGGPAFCDADGFWRHWYSAIGSRWGVYSVAYAESADGIHWNRGSRYGDNLALGPKTRDVSELIFLSQSERWQDQSVSYPSVISTGKGFRMYYSGNDYGVGGIGTAVSAPMRLALSGESGGKAKVWIFGHDGTLPLSLCEFVETNEYGTLSGGRFEEGFTSDTTPFFEQFPESNGKSPVSIRVLAAHRVDGIRIDWMAENKTDKPLTNLRIALKGVFPAFSLELKDGRTECEGDTIFVSLGNLKPYCSASVQGMLTVK